jgi:hypothetical protein
MTVETSKTELDELADKVLIGINRALRKLTEAAAANNESLIVADKNGNPQSVPAKELLKTLPKQSL